MGSRVFTYLRNDLAQDHRTLLFDMRGHGRSDSSAQPLSIPLLAEDLCRTMDALDIPSAYLCSYALGSLPALEAMLAHPDRIRGAALLSGVAQAGGARIRLMAKAGMAAASLRAQELISLTDSWRHADSPETFRNLRAEGAAGDPEKWREYLSACLQYSAADRLRHVKQPVLLLYGEKDRVFLPSAKDLQQGLPNVSAAWIPGVRHTLPVHSAGTVGKLIRGWIEALDEGRDEPKRRYEPGGAGLTGDADRDADSRPHPTGYR
jgi:pimeloyl-ACP methyl ester carboxylesterase